MITPDNMPEQQEDSFPISVFPEPIREIISETKACPNYPTDYIAYAICFTLSVGIGNNFVAKVKEGCYPECIRFTTPPVGHTRQLRYDKERLCTQRKPFGCTLYYGRITQTSGRDGRKNKKSIRINRLLCNPFVK